MGRVAAEHAPTPNRENIKRLLEDVVDDLLLERNTLQGKARVYPNNPSGRVEADGVVGLLDHLKIAGSQIVETDKISRASYVGEPASRAVVPAVRL